MAGLTDEPGPGRRERLRRELAIAGIAGPLAGIGAGLMARIAMRSFAMAIDRPGEFTIGGTLGIVLIGGTIAGAMAGLAYAIVRRLVPGPWPIPGLVLGLAAVAGLVWPFLGGASGEGSENPAAARGLFAAVAVVSGLLIAWTSARVRLSFTAGGWTTDGWPAVGALISILIVLILIVGTVSGLAGALGGGG